MKLLSTTFLFRFFLISVVFCISFAAATGNNSTSYTKSKVVGAKTVSKTSSKTHSDGHAAMTRTQSFHDTFTVSEPETITMSKSHQPAMPNDRTATPSHHVAPPPPPMTHTKEMSMTTLLPPVSSTTSGPATTNATTTTTTTTTANTTAPATTRAPAKTMTREHSLTRTYVQPVPTQETATSAIVPSPTTSSTSSASNNGTTTSAPATTAMMTTTSTTPSPPAGKPRVQFTINTGANATGNITVTNFRNALALKLGIPASSMSVEIGSAGVITVEFITANATAEFAAATAMDNTELQSLGAAAVTSIAPATTAAPPSDDGDDKLPLIIGCAVGGFVLLVIILVIIKKNSSGGSGTSSNDRYEEGNRGQHGGPMLELPQTSKNVL